MYGASEIRAFSDSDALPEYFRSCCSEKKRYSATLKFTIYQLLREKSWSVAFFYRKSPFNWASRAF
ncbi:MAG: hypothetical protein OFPI_13980 [Osedax symbiont Rs2]|nr:MAG: hypothetical protein OFPI_13980 [Osedax symbiont Rs2]